MEKVDIRKRMFSFPRARKLLKELDEYKVTVIVPKIAIMYNEPTDINTYPNTQSKRNKLNTVLGYEDKLDNMYKTKFSNNLYEEKLTVDSEVDVEYINGEINKKAYYKKTEAYLPLSEVIQIYNNGYTVRVPNKNSLIRLLDKLEYIYNNLEIMRVPELEPIIELIENFYKSIIEEKGEELDNYLIKRRLSKSNSVLSLLEEKLNNDNLTVMHDKEGNTRVIDLSDLVVNPD